MKKIIIDSQEEIELTEQEEKIYKIGRADGLAIGFAIMVIVVLGVNWLLSVVYNF